MGFSGLTGPERALPADVSDFVGDWRLERRIDDAATGQVITGEGRAEVQPDGAGGYVYDETLRLAFPGRSEMTGTRRYLWRGVPDGVAVAFEDGRAFHRVALRGASAQDHHACAPDSYAVRYDFGDWPTWTAHWTVRGPRKDYVMSTTYRRG